MVVLGWLPVKPCRQGLSVKPRSRYWRQTGVMHQQCLSRYAADGFTLRLFGLELPCSRCLYRLRLRGRGVYVRYTTANCSSAAYWVGQFVVGCRSVFRLVSLVHRLVPPIGVCSPPRASPDSYLWPGHTFRVRCSSWLACVVSRAHMREHGSYPEAAWTTI